jgi:CRP/FNR family transcriptional regulator
MPRRIAAFTGAGRPDPAALARLNAPTPRMETPAATRSSSKRHLPPRVPAPARAFDDAPSATDASAPTSDHDAQDASIPCSTCPLRAVRVRDGTPAEPVPEVDFLVQSRRRIRRGEHLHLAGEAFTALYAVRSGFLKCYIDAVDGRCQVVGFPMAGDMVGMDAIETERHPFNVIALEDSEVCVMPYARLRAATLRSAAVQRQLHRMMSREIVRAHRLALLLGGMRAESRVAAFLLDVSKRFAARGYSPARFHLRMTREDIGSYLGLKLETVSRALSRFQGLGLLKAELRSVSILDPDALSALVPDRGEALRD